MSMVIIVWVLIGIVIFGLGILFLHTFRKADINGDISAKKGQRNGQEWPTIDPSLDEVIKAVRVFSDHLPKGVSRTILVKADHRIDFEQLAPILKGIPSKPFYLSKETYDIFEEAEKHIPPVLDKVQKAVDLYVKENNQFPALPYDPLRRVNYFQLLQGHYLKEEPEITLYITDYDGLVSHLPPKKKQSDK